jgi:hypothetical protein
MIAQKRSGRHRIRVGRGQPTRFAPSGTATRRRSRGVARRMFHDRVSHRGRRARDSRGAQPQLVNRSARRSSIDRSNADSRRWLSSQGRAKHCLRISTVWRPTAVIIWKIPPEFQRFNFPLGTRLPRAFGQLASRRPFAAINSSVFPDAPTIDRLVPRRTPESHPFFGTRFRVPDSHTFWRNRASDGETG